MILKDLFSSINVDAFITEDNIEKLFPISESVKYIPSWWKNLPKQYYSISDNGINVPTGTMRKCPGFIELYKKGLTIPLWSDVIISTDHNGWRWQSPYKGFNLEPHSKEQFGDSFDDFFHVKFFSPWFMTEKTGVNFITTPAIWNISNLWNDVVIVNGILEFKYQNSTHINLFIKKAIKEITFDAGMPLVHLIPLTEKKVKLKRHIISNEEYSKMFRNTTSFFNTDKYKKFKNFWNKS